MRGTSGSTILGAYCYNLPLHLKLDTERLSSLTERTGVLYFQDWINLVLNYFQERSHAKR